MGDTSHGSLPLARAVQLSLGSPSQETSSDRKRVGPAITSPMMEFMLLRYSPELLTLPVM